MPVTISSKNFFNRSKKFFDAFKNVIKELSSIGAICYIRNAFQQRKKQIYNSFHTNNIHFFRRAG